MGKEFSIRAPPIFSYLAVFILWNQISTCMSTDDYAYLGKVYKEQERQLRSSAANGRMDGLYSIESPKSHLFLTAKNGLASVGPVVLKKWSDSASQLWTITKFDTSRGYSMKPLANEFNLVTSSLKDNAHSYNAWEFKNVMRTANTYIIYNTLNRRCLQTPGFKGTVKFEKCQPNNVLQQWKLNKIA